MESCISISSIQCRARKRFEIWWSSPFKETQHYVKVIPDNFKNYTGQKLTSKNVRWTGETISGGSGAKGDAKKVIDIAKSWLNKSNKYVFGGGRSQRDIDAGRFDCSSWVRYVFDKAGYNLGPMGSVSTETLKKKGKGVKKSELKPGDLVFFHTYKTNGHITIYLGNNKCIGTQSSTGVAIIDMTNSYWGPRLSNTLRRII
ncbi:C40 family peptidase [Bacillus stercoris]|nr:C40 family peptidase [Bacillus stercoris]